MSKVIGIDLGTTNSCVAVMEGGEPVVIPNAQGARITPSVVAINKYGERLVGEVAWRQAITNPENTVFSIKRLMGRKYDDPEIDRYKRLVPYKVMRANNGDAWVELQGRTYSPPEISAMILQKLKTDAEAYLGERVMQAVITVPAHFNAVQRQATRDAGRIAGLDVLRIINEPTAASLAYGLDKKKDERVAVYSFGGGTFDISILELGDGVFDVRSTTGDPQLGGDDFDHCVMNWLADEFRKEHGIDLRHDRMALQRLKEAAEKAKKELSSSTQAEINLPFITADTRGPKHLSMILTRSRLEQLVESLIEKSRAPVMKALKDAEIRPSDIQEAVLVGGQTRMPAVQELVRRIFDREPHRGVNPDEVVAVGAAIQAGVLTGDIKDVLLLDVTPFSLGIETLGGVSTHVIERNTTIPTQRSQIFSTDKDNQPSFEVNILQGERDFAKDNHSLGSFILDGIPPAPRGVPQIEVTFDIDANGILNVSARDKGTGREQKITVVVSSGLSKDQIDRMVRDAEMYAAEEKRRKEEVEERDQADSAAYRAERSILELGKSITSQQKREIESMVAVIRTALSTDDIASIKAAREALTRTFDNIMETIHNQENDTGSAPGDSFDSDKQIDQGALASDDTIEIEYKDVDGSLSATTDVNLKGSEKKADQDDPRDHKVEKEPAQAEAPSQSVPRIFVSHSHIDNDFGSRLAQDLRKVLGDESAVWYDVLGGLHGGDTWWERILDELTTRDIFIVVLSPDAMNSAWVRREINMALNEGKLIIPLLYRNCIIRADLKTLQYISFLPHETYHNAFNELLTALGMPKDEEARTPTSKLEDPESQVVQRMTPLIEAAFSKRDWSDVLRKVDYLLKRAPNAIPASVYRIQGLALFARGDRQHAQEALDIALALVNDDVLRLTLLRDYTTILTSLGQWNTILTFADEALQLSPDDLYWLNLQKQANNR